MNVNSDIDFFPSQKLLPFGGFEVAALLLKLQDSDNGPSIDGDGTVDCQPMIEVSSGWLRSKMLAG